MKKKMIASLALFTVVPGLLLAATPRVAVAHFEYATVRNQVVELFGSDVDLGKGVADMVEAKLAESGHFRVYERRRMGVIMAEQEDSNSARFDPRTAVRLGQLTGAEYVLLGSITRLGRDDGRKGMNVGSWLGRWAPAGDITIGKGKAKAVIGLTIKLVDVRTGEIVIPAEAVGESSRGSSSFGGIVHIAGRSVSGGSAMTAENFGQTILGEAAANASAQLSAQLTKPELLARVKGRAAAEIKVAKISNGSIYLAGGESTGLKNGDVVEIHQIEEMVPDPDDPTKVLDIITRKVAEATVEEVKERMTIARINGSFSARPEDQFIARRRG